MAELKLKREVLVPTAGQSRFVGALNNASVDFRELGEQLARTEERSRLILQATSDITWDWDMVKGTIWWGQGSKHTLGDIPTEMPFDEYWKRVHPDDQPHVVKTLNAATTSSCDTWSAEYR